MQAEKLIQQSSLLPDYKIERILYTTDLSCGIEEALDYAITLALTYNAKLFMFNCVEPTLWDIRQGERERVQNSFKELVGESVSPTDPPVLKWDGIIKAGIAAEEIVSEARNINADLIIMRSRRRPYAAALLGSTAETICRTAPCPVLVTHPIEREWVDKATGKPNLKRILVAWDFSDYSRIALAAAFSFAKAFESEVHLLHVLPEGEQHAWSPLFQDPVYQSENNMKLAVPEGFRSALKIEYKIHEGTAYKEILNYARKNGIDLICLGAHGEGFTSESTFGSNADLVLRKALCPIFVARKGR